MASCVSVDFALGLCVDTCACACRGLCGLYHTSLADVDPVCVRLCVKCACLCPTLRVCVRMSLLPHSAIIGELDMELDGQIDLASLKGEPLHPLVH